MSARKIISPLMAIALLSGFFPSPALAQASCTHCGADINTHVTVKIQVLWQGDEPIQDQRPQSVEVSIEREVQDDNGQRSIIPLDRDRITATSHASPYMGWAVSFTCCPDGKKTIKYDVKQNEGADIPGYHTEITSADGVNFTITNVLQQNHPSQTDSQEIVYVTVFWNDNYNAKHLRPKNVEITLHQDNGTQMTGLATSANGWACRFSGSGFDTDTPGKYYVVKPNLIAYDTLVKQDPTDPAGQTFTITNTLKAHIVPKKHTTAKIQDKKPATTGTAVPVPKVPLF
ncbi:MAG: Cna B-type domain-containing protein [Peptococcaceae bacterium]|nr:Cna B-type domain-containing protein [Peptococcaceae bacterium]